MKTRRRFKQTESLEQRLEAEASEYSELAAKTPPGPQRDLYLKRARQCESGARMSQWLHSTGAQQPK
jgi:hypothetical protein